MEDDVQKRIEENRRKLDQILNNVEERIEWYKELLRRYDERRYEKF